MPFELHPKFQANRKDYICQIKKSGSPEDFPHGESVIVSGPIKVRRVIVGSPWSDAWQAARVHGRLPPVTLQTLIGPLKATMRKILENLNSKSRACKIINGTDLSNKSDLEIPLVMVVHIKQI